MHKCAAHRLKCNAVQVQGVCSERTQVARATPDRKGRQQDPHTDARDAIRRAGAFSQSQLLRAVVNVGPLAVSAIAWGPSGGKLPGAITHNADTGDIHLLLYRCCYS